MTYSKDDTPTDQELINQFELDAIIYANDLLKAEKSWFTAIELRNNETIIGLCELGETEDESDLLIVHLPRLIYKLSETDNRVSFGYTTYSPFIRDTSTLTLNPDLIQSMYTPSYDLQESYFEYWKQKIILLQKIDNIDTNVYHSNIDTKVKYS